MKKSILPVVVIVLATIMVGCGSTQNTYTPPETNAGSVSLAFISTNENPRAKRALQTALDLFEKQRYIEAEQAFWALDKDYSSEDFGWNIRVVSAALTCQLAQGDVHRFENDVQILRHYTSGVANLPRQTQVLLSMAESFDGASSANTQSTYIDTRISNWFNALQE